MENLNDKIKFSNGIEASVSELQVLIDCINNRDFEYACDLLKLWKHNANNLARETEQIAVEKQLEHERIRELKSDD